MAARLGCCGVTGTDRHPIDSVVDFLVHYDFRSFAILDYVLSQIWQVDSLPHILDERLCLFCREMAKGVIERIWVTPTRLHQWQQSLFEPIFNGRFVGIEVDEMIDEHRARRIYARQMQTIEYHDVGSFDSLLAVRVDIVSGVRVEREDRLLAPAYFRQCKAHRIDVVGFRKSLAIGETTLGEHAVAKQKAVSAHNFYAARRV